MTTANLHNGLEEVVHRLGNESGRRVLFLIGDGFDQIAGWNVRGDVTRLREAGIEVYVLGASPSEPVWANQNRLRDLGKLGAYRYAPQREQLPELAGILANEMNAVYEVEFPDVQDGKVLPLDGVEHSVKLRAGTAESVADDMDFPGPLACLPGAGVKCLCPGQPQRLGPDCPTPPLPIFGFVLLGLGVSAVGGLVLVTLRRRRVEVEELEPAPPEVVLPAPPVIPVEPPRRTEMIRLSPEEDDIPIVAWIVPLAGPCAYQTIRLGDRTTIGAGHKADICLVDPKMSALHAEILFTDGGYVLFDLKSRNGVHFYDKPITKHTLIDNDLFTCGTTPFKFKTTLS